MPKRLLFFLSLLTAFSEAYSQKGSGYTTIKTESAIIYDIRFTPGGEALAVADNTTIKMYATDTWQLLSAFNNGHKKQILAIDVAENGSLLVSGGKDSTIVVWDFVQHRPLQSLRYHTGIVTSVQISADGRYLVSGGTDNKVYLYDLEKQEVVQVFADHQDDVTTVKFSPDGKYIASAGGDKLINVYEVATKKLLTSLSGHKSWVREVSFSKDGKRLISGGDDSKIISWLVADMNNIRMLHDSNTFTEWVLSTDFHTNSNVYAYGGLNGKGRVISPYININFKVGRPINKIRFKPNEEHYIKAVVATRGKGVILIDVQHL